MLFICAKSAISGISRGIGVDQPAMEEIMRKMAQKTRTVDGVKTSLLDLGYEHVGLVRESAVLCKRTTVTLSLTAHRTMAGKRVGLAPTTAFMTSREGLS